MRQLTKKERDCVVVLGKSTGGSFPNRLIDLSETMEIRPPTALNLVKRLETKKVLEHRKGMIILTKNGVNIFHEIEENHRILETLMVKYGMDVDKACLLSETIDFQIDHIAVDKMFEKLGKPEKCPHGREITQFHEENK